MFKLKIFRKACLDAVLMICKSRFYVYNFRCENRKTVVFNFSAVMPLIAVTLFSSSMNGKNLDHLKYDQNCKFVIVSNAKANRIMPNGPTRSVKYMELRVDVVQSSVVVTDTITDVVYSLMDSNSLHNNEKLEQNSSEDKVVENVSVLATPVNGMGGFAKTFLSRFNKPKVERNVEKLEVFLSFIVEKDGRLSNIKLLLDPGYGAGQEAVRVLSTMPKWKAALLDNRNVRSHCILPITIEYR